MDLNAVNQKFDSVGGFNFAAIRLPQSNDIYFFYALQKPAMRRLELTTQTKPIFVCSPYGAGNMAYYLDADIIYKNDKLIFGDASLFSEQNPHPKTQTSVLNFCADKDFYCNYVEQSVSTIEANILDKTVAARCKEVELPKTFNQAAFFHQLLQQYSNACVYYFYIEGTGSWMGATPERLLTVSTGVLETVALAGTLPLDSNTQWTQKERDEQHITEDFIEQVFISNKITGYNKTTVEEVQAGQIKHLCSAFNWKPDTETLQKKFHKILNDLNPTPAVCGMPQFGASSFIAQNEKMERRFYSGFVGMINEMSAISLYVNLRCMELGNNNALLYAGAGITKDSSSEKEWLETEQKMATLNSLL